VDRQLRHEFALIGGLPDDRSIPNTGGNMRLIHTSDWQIGKAYGFADDATREILRNERLEAIVRLGQLAQHHGTGTVLVAGDVYDVASPSDRTLRQPIERMRQVPGVTWHLIPGNHDPHTIRPVGPADPDGAARQRQASPHPRAGRSRRRLRLPGAGRAHTPPCRG
jgi:hypothetical protein